MKVAKRWPASIALGLALLAGACSGPPIEAPAGDTELQLGQTVYTRNCASCHGSDGAGGRGVRLNEGAVLTSFPDVADQVDVIENGRRTMPAFSGRLTEEDIAAVARYTREVLNP